MPQTKFENNTKIVVIPPSAFSDRGYSANIHPEGYVYFTKSDATDCAPLGNVPVAEDKDVVAPASESPEVAVAPERLSDSRRGSCDISESSISNCEDATANDDSGMMVRDAKVIPVINIHLDQSDGNSSVKLSNKQRRRNIYKRLNKNLLLVRNMNDVQKQSLLSEKDGGEADSGEHAYCQAKDDSDQGCGDDDGVNNGSRIKPEESASIEDDAIREKSNLDNSPECGTQSEDLDENVIGRTATENDGLLISTNKKTILLDESELEYHNGSGAHTDSEDLSVKNNNVTEEKSPVHSLYGKRKLHKSYKISWGIQISCDGFARCLIETCNFISLDLQTIQEHYKLCDGVQHYDQNLCPLCNNWLSSENELLIHKAKCKGKSKTLTELSDADKDGEEISRFQKSEDNKEDGASSGSESSENRPNASATDDNPPPPPLPLPSPVQTEEKTKYCDQCDQEFSCDAEYLQHVGSCEAVNRKLARARKKRDPKMCDSSVWKKKIKDEFDDNCIVQPPRDIPKDQYIRRRASTKQHKRIWEAAIKKDKHVKCIFQNCHFLALSVEDMISHFGYCNGDGSYARFVCPYCEGRVTSEKVLEIHIRRSHLYEDFEERKSHFLDGMLSNEDESASPRSESELPKDVARHSAECDAGNERDAEVKKECEFLDREDESRSCKEETTEQITLREEAYRSDEENATENVAASPANSESEESVGESSQGGGNLRKCWDEDRGEEEDEDSVLSDDPNEMIYGHSVFQNSQTQCCPKNCLAEKNYKDDHIYYKRMSNPLACCSKGFKSLLVMKNDNARHYSGPKNDVKAQGEKTDEARVVGEDEDGGIDVANEKTCDGDGSEGKGEQEGEEERDESTGKYVRQKIKFSFPSIQTTKRKILKYYIYSWLESIKTNGFARCLVATCNFISLDIYHIQNHFKTCDGVPARGPNLCTMCNSWLPSAVELSIHASKCKANFELDGSSSPSPLENGLSDTQRQDCIDMVDKVEDASSPAHCLRDPLNSHDALNEDQTEPEKELTCRVCRRKFGSATELNDHDVSTHRNEAEDGSEKENATSLRISHIKKLKENDGLGPRRIIQPGPDLPKGQYLRRRPYTKQHKAAWESTLEKLKYVKCIFQNCHFLAMSLEDMIYHFGYCIGDGSFAKFECPHCGGRLTTKKILDIHVRLSHSDKLPDDRSADGEEEEEEEAEAEAEEAGREDSDETSELLSSLDDMRKLLLPKEVKTYGKVSKNAGHSDGKEDPVREEDGEESGPRDSFNAENARSEQGDVKQETEGSVVEANADAAEYDGAVPNANGSPKDGGEVSAFVNCDKLVEEETKNNEVDPMAEDESRVQRFEDGERRRIEEESNASEERTGNGREDQPRERTGESQEEDGEGKKDECENSGAVSEEVSVAESVAENPDRGVKEPAVDGNGSNGQGKVEAEEKNARKCGKRGGRRKNGGANESQSEKSTKESNEIVSRVTRSTRQSLERNAEKEGKLKRSMTRGGDAKSGKSESPPAKRRRADASKGSKEEEASKPGRQTRRRGRPPRASVNDAPHEDEESDGEKEAKVEVEPEPEPEPPKKSRRGRKRKCEVDAEPPKAKGESCRENEEVKCAKCGLKTRRKNFTDHNYKKHVGLAWIEGDEPVDMNNEESLSWIVKQAFKVIKTATCENCESVKRSALGFISHVQNCGKTQEEKEASKVSCPYCPARVLKYSLPMHLKLSHPQTPPDEPSTEKETPNEEPNLEHPTKRRSALNAINKFQEVLKQCNDEEDIKSKAQYVFYEKGVSKFPKLPQKIRGLWNKMKKEDKKIPCRRGSCLIESSNVHEAVRHHFQCPELPDKVYVCQLCDYYSTEESNIQQHVNIHATMDEDFAVGSEEERLEEEAEISAQMEAEEYGDEPEPCPKIPDGAVDENSIEAAYRTKFFWREGIVNERKKQFFRQSLLMTLESEKEDMAERMATLTQLHSKVKDWTAVSSERAARHLPSLRESVSFDANSRIGRKDFDWKRFKRFEGGLIEGMPFMFTGGSVLSMSWCKISYNKLKARSMRQYLAVSSSRKMDKYQNIHEPCDEPSGLIQIWDCGALKSLENAAEAPKMALGLLHDSGTVWDLSWFPVDSMEESKDEELVIRLGLLGAACQDGTVRIWSVRNPDLLHNDSGLPLYRVEPCVILELEQRSREGCLRLAFGRTGIVAGGFTNGIVAVWNLKTIASPFCKTSGTSWVLKPHISIQAHRTSITALSICPNSDRYIATSGLDRYVKFWDLESAGNPFEHVLKEVCLDNVWPRHWPLTISTFEDIVPCCGKGMIKPVRDAYCDKHRAPLAMDNTCWSLSFNEWMNILCGCNNVGQVRIRYFRNMFLADEKIQFSVCRTCMTTETMLLGEPRGEDLKGFLTGEGSSTRGLGLDVPRTYDEANRRFGLVFHDGDPHPVQKGKGNAGKCGKKGAEYSIDAYPITSVNKVSWNPNFDCFTHLAVGHHSGMVTVKRVLDGKSKDQLWKFFRDVSKEEDSSSS